MTSRIATLCLLIGLCLALIAMPASAQDLESLSVASTPTVGWLQYRFDTAHTGFNPAEKTINATNVTNLQYKCKFDYDSSLPYANGNTSPALLSGVAIVTAAFPAKVYAINTSDCSLKWKFDQFLYGTNTITSPAVATVKIPAKPTPIDVVYVFADDQVLYAIDASDGVLIWSMPVNDGNSAKIMSSPTIATVNIGGTDTQVVYLSVSYVWAFQADTGSPLPSWNASGVVGRSVDHPDGLTSTPAVHRSSIPTRGQEVIVGGEAYGTHAGLWAISADHGKTVWHQSALGEVYGSPSIPPVSSSDQSSRRAFVGSGTRNNGGQFYKVDTFAGYVLWSYAKPSCSSAYSSSPAVWGENGSFTTVYVGSWDYCFGLSTGHLTAFNKVGDGTPIWESVDLDAEVTLSSPAVANGVVYVADWQGTLYAFDAKGCSSQTCNWLWKNKFSNAYFGLNDTVGSPAVDNGRVFISDGHSLYAFSLFGL
jgi:outer membrane protein assembly factor BamB